jgi:hypothetical protein
VNGTWAEIKIEFLPMGDYCKGAWLANVPWAVFLKEKKLIKKE